MYLKYDGDSFDEGTTMVQVDDEKFVVTDNSNHEELQSKIVSMMENISGGEWKCKVCSKLTKGGQTQMKRHVETHLEGMSYPCNKCGKVSRSSNGLIMHVTREHRANKF